MRRKSTKLKKTDNELDLLHVQIGEDLEHKKEQSQNHQTQPNLDHLSC